MDESNVYPPIIFTAFLGIIGWIIIQFIFTPIMKYKAERNNISELLTFYAHFMTSLGCADTSEASDKFRVARATLETAINNIPAYSVYSFLHLLPEKKQLQEVYKALIFISNGIPQTDKIIILQIVTELANKKKLIIKTLNLPIRD